MQDIIRNSFLQFYGMLVMLNFSQKNKNGTDSIFLKK